MKNNQGRPQPEGGPDDYDKPEFTPRLAMQRIKYRELDAATAELLKGGDRHGRYGSGSELAMSLAVRFRNHGHSYDNYLDAMMDKDNEASTWFYELRDGRPRTSLQRRKSARGRARAQAELKRCWDKAGNLPAPRSIDVSDVWERCEGVWAFADARMHGRTRATRLTVLEVVLLEAVRYQTDRVLAPVRLIAEKAGVSPGTVRASLHDLVSLGALSLAESEAEGTVFRVNQCTVLDTDFLTSGKWGRSVSVDVHSDVGSYLGASLKKSSPAHHDCWRHGDLGRSGRAIYNTLTGDIPLTPASITRLTGLHRNTVAAKLRQLERRGLAHRVEGRWTQGEAEPSEVAESGKGKRKRDRERYAAEREQYRRFKESRTPIARLVAAIGAQTREAQTTLAKRVAELEARV